MKKMWCLTILTVLVAAGCAEQKRDRALPKALAGTAVTKNTQETAEELALRKKRVQEECAKVATAQQAACIEEKMKNTDPALLNEVPAVPETINNGQVPTTGNPPAASTDTTLATSIVPTAGNTVAGTLDLKLEVASFGAENSSEVAKDNQAIGVFTGEGANSNVGQLSQGRSTILCAKDVASLKDLSVPKIGQMETATEEIVNRITLLEGSKISYAAQRQENKFIYAQKTCGAGDASLNVAVSDLREGTQVIELNELQPVAYGVQATILSAKGMGAQTIDALTKASSYSGLRLLNIGCNVNTLVQKLEGNPIQLRLEVGSQVLLHVVEGSNIRTALVRCAAPKMEATEQQDTSDEQNEAVEATTPPAATAPAIGKTTTSTAPSGVKNTPTAPVAPNPSPTPTPTPNPEVENKAVSVFSDLEKNQTTADDAKQISSKCAANEASLECVQESMIAGLSS